MKRLLAYSFLSAALGLAMAAGASAEQVVSGDVPAAAAGSAPYWSKSRMANAKAFPMLQLGGEPSPQGSVPDPGAGLAPRASRGGKKGQSFLGSASDAVAASLSGAVQQTGYSYPPPHTTFNVLTSLYTTYPYSTVGRIFFTSGGVNYSCSGASIGNRAVLTAGHCVSNGSGAYHTNWVFVPAYQNGSAPYGQWSAFRLGAMAPWHFLGNYCRDVGYAAVSDQAGVTLSATVGWLGLAHNWSSVQHWNMLGYPAGAPYDGRWLTETQASHSRNDNPGCFPATLGIGTTQTGGTSGGPRIVSFYPGSTGAANYINGVNSYVYSSQPNELFSPYFDNAVKTLYDTAVAQ